MTPETQAEKARREAELAKALRANLRRRKAGPASEKSGDEDPS